MSENKKITITTNYNQNLTFEIVDSVPIGYDVWNISMPPKNKNILPLCKIKDYPFADINSLKAILIDGADKITLACFYHKHERNPLESMKIYCKKYKNAKGAFARYKAQIFAEAIPILKKIKWD